MNIDDKNGIYMTQNTALKNLYHVDEKPADFTLRVLENTINGMKLKIDNTEIQTSIIGNFNAYNLLAVSQ